MKPGMKNLLSFQSIAIQKQPCSDVLKKRCSKNMQQIYRRTHMPNSNFNNVAVQLYWSCTLAWVVSCKFAAYFQNTFTKNISGGLVLAIVNVLSELTESVLERSCIKWPGMRVVASKGRFTMRIRFRSFLLCNLH